MAVALLDAVADTGASSFGSPGSFTVSAGSERVLYHISVIEGPGNDVATMEYGGQAMTELIDVLSTSGNDARTQLWALNEAGIAAATDGDFTPAGTAVGQTYRSFAFSVTGGLQALTLADSDNVTNQGISGEQLSVSSVAEGAVLAVAVAANEGDISWSGITERLEVDNAMTVSAAFDTTSSAGTVNATPTLTGGGGAQNSFMVALQTEPGGTIQASTSASMSMTASSTPAALPEVTGLDNFTRRVFVSQSGNDSNNGLSAGAAKLTVQAALNIAQAGDVISIGPGHYFETPTLSNFTGTTTDRLWIVAERRGEVTISNYWEDAYNGTQVWDDEGGGTYSAVHGDAWSGSHGGDFLFRYQSQADLEAATLSVDGLISNPNVITKPQYGFAIEGGRVYVKLRNDVNPNGEQVKLTDSFSQTIVDFNNCDFVILDGIRVEGSGDTPAIEFDSASSDIVIRNVISNHSRGLCRHSSNTLVEWCEYTYEGFFNWMVELLTLDGIANLGVFDINKNYNVTNGNTHYEGGMAFGTNSTDANVEHRFNYIHGIFDGMRAGAFDNADIHDNVIIEFGDNAVEFESFRDSDLAANIRFFHNLLEMGLNGYTSHQGSVTSLATGPVDVYRNVLVADDAVFSHPPFLIKMINSDLSPNFTDIRYYHNLFKNLRGDNGEASPIDFNGLWADHFSTFDADAITLFANNVALYDDGLDSGSGPNPQNISDNILAAPSDNTVYQGGGGSRVANEAALLLGSNFELLSGSPLIGAGGALSGSLPDVETGPNRNDDVGPFPDGFDPGPDWPRVAATTFNNNLPDALQLDSTATSASVSGSVVSEQRVAAGAAVSASVSGSAVAEQRLAPVSTSVAIALTTTADATAFIGPQANASLVMTASATPEDPPPAVPALLLADSFAEPQNLRPVILVDLFFENAEVNIWTRPVRGIFDGKEYQPLAGITSGITVRNSLDQGSLDISIDLSGQSDELLNIALTENFQRRPATVRLGNLSEDYSTVLAEEVILVGTIANMPVSDSATESRVSVVIDSVFREVARPRILRLSAADQALTNPDDSFFAFEVGAEIETQRFGGS